jgi:2-polyprenyl-3-methyl-5-hydroxy-6-metoxy-1,4-benzoquinol methylase
MVEYKIPSDGKFLKFTGERYVAGLRGEIEFEHYHRYLFSLQFCAGKSVLDVASGEGYGGYLVQQVAASVVGVDIHQESVEHAQLKYGSSKLTYIQADCASLPFQERQFDVVLSFETLEHTIEQERFISEIKRVLKPDGLLIISTPDRRVYSPTGISHNEFHLRELDKTEFEELLNPYFSNISIARQKATAGSLIMPEEGYYRCGEPSRAAPVDLFFKSDDETYVKTETLQRAYYLIGLAADAEVPQVRWSALDDDKFTHELRAASVTVSGSGDSPSNDEIDATKSEHVDAMTLAERVSALRDQNGSLNAEYVADLMRQLRLQEGIASPHNISVLSGLTWYEREEFARMTGTMVLYVGDEVAQVKSAEEAAALRAAPYGYDLKDLNGLNIGCGDRVISNYIQPVDVMRRSIGDQSSAGVHHALTEHALLSLPDQLPYAPESIDFIVALHMLEHVEDPVGIVDHWLNILKPGGGIGLVLPHWKYTWDSRKDGAPFGHKWNPTPALLRDLFARHWSSKSDLISVESYPFKISFDVVLRKHGKFEPFQVPSFNQFKSGHQRFVEGLFLHGE